jgi:transcriptional regulator with XRE-family HTH domain
VWNVQQPASTDIVREEDVAFGTRLAEARQKAGISQRALAGAMGERGLSIDPSAITRIEKGERSVRLGEVRLMSEVLGISLNALLNGDDPRSEIEVLREEANEAMRTAQSNAAKFLHSTLAVRALLLENPDLVQTLGDSTDDAPASANEYLDWVLGRLRRQTGVPVSALHPTVTAGDTEVLMQMAATLTATVAKAPLVEFADSYDDYANDDSVDGPRDRIVLWATSVQAALSKSDDTDYRSLGHQALAVGLRVAALKSDAHGLGHLEHELRGLHDRIGFGYPPSYVSKNLDEIRAKLEESDDLRAWLAADMRKHSRYMQEFAEVDDSGEEDPVADTAPAVAAELRALAKTADAEALARAASLVDRFDVRFQDLAFEDDDDTGLGLDEAAKMLEELLEALRLLPR